ncbi:MAG: hypothetical protein IJP26_00660 [Clostridia bacterium]|nr:hypothetical protein [Clostridia bacterium]
MKVAVVGSRELSVNNLEKYLPYGTTEIVSGGAVGIDSSARRYAKKCGITLTEFLPDYENYGRSAPIRRNADIVNYADVIVAFWDGASHGTKFVIENAKKRGKKVIVYVKK